MTYENNLSCPLMGGKPCMGKSCACSATRVAMDEIVTFCGLVGLTGHVVNAAIISIESNGDGE